MKTRIALIGILITVTAFAAFARPGHGGFGGHGGMRGGAGIFGHLKHLKEELNLTDNQAAQIKVIFAELHEQNTQYRQSMRGGLHDVAEVLLKNPNDLAGAQAILEEQAAAERALKTNMLTATSKALNVLTADQRAKLTEIVAERAERMERRRR